MWHTGQQGRWRGWETQEWLLEKMSWMARKQDLSHITSSHSQAWGVASLPVQSSHLKCDLPFGQGHELPALLGLLLPPPFFI